MKRGRPQLKEGELRANQRQIRVGQLDWQKLERCYQEDIGDDEVSIYDGSGRLSSNAITQILQRYIFFCSEEKEEGEKKAACGPS